ncbi:hypothetical protein KIPB_003629 [Kipferlia bialata]|uniref:Uncharacterized protein n=1 Tax=Kipferlia bialata TaxID=797122 RepID=A0A9K3CUR2_9EUKA|nr:hypothetical protein KIPB_003629 [Kipferlia bialata]|eukprot:g3629.t1
MARTKGTVQTPGVYKDPINKATAKRKYAVTDTDLKRLESIKIGRNVCFQESDVLAAALRKHGGKAGLERAQQSALLSGTSIGGMTVEQHRRRLGDAVKGQIEVEKYCIAARCHCTVDCDIEVFKALVVPNADTVLPSTFDTTSPVVVASVTGNAHYIFGSTKLSGGTMYGSWSANRMELVFIPSEKKMRIWWTMS